MAAKKKRPAKKTGRATKKPVRRQAARKPAARKAAPKKTKRAAPARRAVKAKAKAKPKAKNKTASREFGEGNYKASKRFRTEQETFVKNNKARIPALGKAAEAALEGPEGGELRAAEAAAAAGHAAGPGNTSD